MGVSVAVLRATLLGMMVGVATWMSPLSLKTAHAATFTVNSQTDAVDATPGDGLCATVALTGEGVRCTLRAAIMESNALAGADTLTLPEGTYTLSIPGVNEDAGATGDLDVTEVLTITGAGKATTTISGTRIDRVFDVKASAVSVAISGVAIRDGDTAGFGDGGGISTHASLRLTDTAVTHNRALIVVSSGSGGGIFAEGAGIQVALVRVDVADNIAPGFGGGVVARGANVSVTESTVLRNSAGSPGAGGGVSGIYVSDSGSLTLTDSNISGNKTLDETRSPAIVVEGGSATLTRVLVEDNSAISGSAGIAVSGSLTATDTTFTRNSSFIASSDLQVFTASGQTSTLVRVQIIDSSGSFHGSGPGTTILTDSLIARNTTGVRSLGGNVQISRTKIGNIREVGVANSGNLILSNSTISAGSQSALHNEIGGNATLQNVTISGNNSQAAVGAAISNSGTLTATNVSMVGNVSSASFGQSVHNAPGATLSFKNSIVSGALDAPLCVGTITSLGHNLETGTTCGFTATGDLQRTDPRIDNLADNGGSTPTHRLQLGSPALDAGTNDGCPSTDQRGLARPKDGDGDGSPVCDIGAFEGQPSEVVLVCSPRPAVRLQIGPGQIQGTVSVTRTALQPANALRQIQITHLSNATVTVNGASQVSGQSVTLPANATQAQVVVTRATPGAFTARLAVTDDCGPWPTFVGGGVGVP